MNSRPRHAVSIFRPSCTAFLLAPVKTGLAGIGYGATLSVLKYIEVEFEMVYFLLHLYGTKCVILSGTFANVEQYSVKYKFLQSK